MKPLTAALPFELILSTLNRTWSELVAYFPSVVDVTHSLAERSALTDSDRVTVLDTEGRRDVCGQVLVALLVTGVLGDEVEVVTADDAGTVHLGGHDCAGQDTAADRDLTSERALLVCRNPSTECSSSYSLRSWRTDVLAVNGGLWCPESQANVLVPSSSLSNLSGLCEATLVVLENVRLLLVSALALNGKLGRHGG